jgi:hypothetical protein
MEFSDQQQVFIENIKFGLNEENNTSARNFELFLSKPKEQLKSEAKLALDRLGELKIRSDRASARTKEAWVKLNSFFSSRKSEMDTLGVAPIVYGSVIFDDPKLLDFDILLVTEDFGDEVERKIDIWMNDLNQVWKNPVKEGHMEHLSLERLRMHCNAFNNNQIDVNTYTEIDFDAAAKVLSGDSLTQSTEKYKEEIWKLAEETPVLMAYIVLMLNQTIGLHEARRLGVE